MAEASTVDSRAFAKLIEPVTARMDALEQRLERIESALARLAMPFTAALQPPPANHGQPGEQETPSTFGFPPTPTRVTHSYKALSYAWDDPPSTLTPSPAAAAAPAAAPSVILIAGASLPLTPNLAAALRQLRTTSTSTSTSSIFSSGSALTETRSLWWIDALCINQADVRERSAQVALMRRIYGSAAHVQVWLGAEGGGSAGAMALVRELGRPSRRGPANPRPTAAAAARAGPPGAEDSGVGVGVVSGEERRRNLVAVAALFQRAWWDRVWVRQEVALGNEVSFLCGGESCTLEELRGMEVALEDSLVRLRLDSKGAGDGGEEESVLRRVQARQLRPVEGFKDLRDKSERGSAYVDLCSLLIHARGCKATDLRDKVYGVLGLADPGVYELAVNYQLLAKDLYRMAARAIITRTDSLNILGAAQNVERLHSLPSWAPNLIDPWKAQPFPINTPAHHRFGSVIWSGLASRRARWQFNESGKVLTVTGQVYGRIARPSTPAARSTHSNDQLAQLLAMWTEFARSALAAQQASGGASYFGGAFNFGGADPGDFPTTEENCMAGLLLIRSRSQQQQGMFGGGGFQFRGSFGRSGSGADVDVGYARSLLAPEPWIESSMAKLALQEGMRRYGVGRRVGHCENSSPGVGLFPEDAQEGDLVVFLNIAES
ncbi:hypothetical protein NEMBOFW57_010164 [Staphylotrichum longicolle]|uniref:Heterokaryon incompatibility domain-containing protein n=1 Tax=Staphylotrichum longicolle TaxID=669026 RepID=A0AAD4EQK8_9PEZI|nr:hypothetical protein NEMBOFW57_010164 [Staphylotrichum longicolle]